MDYFVLRNPIKLKEDQQSYGIPGLVDAFMVALPMLMPTHVSSKNRFLEWLIPNNNYNQSWISQHYSNFEILDAGKEAVIDNTVKIMKNMPKPLAPKTMNDPVMSPQDVAVNGLMQVNNDGSEDEIIPPIPDAEVVSIETDNGPVIVAKPVDLVDSNVESDPRPDKLPDLVKPEATKKLTNIEIGKLKARRIAELIKLEVVIPKNPTLQILDELLSKAHDAILAR